MPWWCWRQPNVQAFSADATSASPSEDSFRASSAYNHHHHHHHQQQQQQHLRSRSFVPFSELVFHQIIGRGSFKCVWRGSWHNTAVAIVAMHGGGLVTEARLMQQLGTHPNLVQFYRWSQDTQGNEYMVMELVALGSLDKVLLHFGEFLRTRVKLSMCEQVCSAMAELGADGVLHRDLAARNVLVASLDPVHVKVADFGLSHAHNSSSSSSSSSGSSSSASGLSSIPVRWAAPEVLTQQAWGGASEVWAFGVVLWEVFANGSEPYAAQNDQEVVQSVLSGARLARPPRCPREVYQLMLHCWAAQPEQRPSFTDILALFRSWRQEHSLQAEAAVLSQQQQQQQQQHLHGVAPLLHSSNSSGHMPCTPAAAPGSVSRSHSYHAGSRAPGSIGLMLL
ncbi:hypothetical protein OEZ86_006515 [Tetradesmus obliquus]|nr:hypothetical protein OEZ86_006515 [Tetradesmus obliquus]